jgi:uracil-DNA glycosylase family 4
MKDSTLKTKERRIQKLAGEIISGFVCEELANQATQLVMGAGNINADIIFIGEAPGKKEDETGAPFVGASGRFLDTMLEAVGMKRDDVYITNIVKYRPPNNRDPSTAEKAEFWPYLVRQIEIIQPKIIITLGRHSGMHFMSDLVISRDHGQSRWITLGQKDYTIVPLYHPAAALYNGSMRETLIDDFRKVASLTAF